MTTTVTQAKEEPQKIKQENKCKVKDGGGNANGGDAKDDSGDGGDGGSGSGNDNSFVCTNDLIRTKHWK